MTPKTVRQDFNENVYILTFLTKKSFDTICADTPKEHLRLLEKVADEDTIAIAINDNARILGFASYRDHENIREAGLIEVDTSSRDKGIATRLIRHCMKQAQNDGITVRLSYFTDMGRDVLLPALPRLHREFPKLKVQYAGCPLIFDGTQSYRAPIPGFDM